MNGLRALLIFCSISLGLVPFRFIPPAFRLEKNVVPVHSSSFSFGEKKKNTRPSARAWDRWRLSRVATSLLASPEEARRLQERFVSLPPQLTKARRKLGAGRGDLRCGSGLQLEGKPQKGVLQGKPVRSGFQF